MSEHSICIPESASELTSLHRLGWEGHLEERSYPEMTGRKYIKLRMVGEDCEEMHFSVKKTTPLSKLMRRYSESKGVGVTSLRFFFDGLRISDSNTAEDVGLTENDEIVAFTGLGSNARWIEC